MQTALPLDSLLSKITDPREQDQLRHPLPALLKLVLLGKLCGRVTLKAAWRLSRRLSPPQLLRLGFTGGTAPCYSTVTETIRMIDADELRLVFATAVRGFGFEDEEAIAVDGKALRGSADEEHRAVKLLSAFCARLSGIIGEVEVPEDHNEITAMLDLLDRVDVEGFILTGDAAFAQKNICDKAVEKKADFVFTVKENQPTLKRRITAAAEAAEASLSPSGKPQNQRRKQV